jgi:hypothetical protein
MGLIDLILNVAGLLLWISWRALGASHSHGPSGISLAATLKRAETGRQPRWRYLAALGALLTIRTFFYWQMGSAVHWMPRLELGVMSLSFRTDYFTRMAVYSLLSFLGMLAGFYLWLLLLALVNRRSSESDPLHRLVRLQLGWVSGWPAAAQLVLPFVAATLLWALLQPLFAQMGLVPRAVSAAHFWQQTLVLGLTVYLLWKYLVLGILLLHLINSYVYLGNHALWPYLNLTARRLLLPLSWLPLRVGRIDLAPLVAMAAVFYGCELASFGLRQLYRHFQL